MTYRHRQVGWPVLVLSDAFLVVGVLLIVSGGAALATGVVLVVAAAVVALGSMLTVVVDDTHVRAAFIAGWPNHRIALADIVSAEPVRNKAWWGFGIRKVPGGWMYNVGGLDAIEIVQRNGKRFRIGTNDPANLHQALT